MNDKQQQIEEIAKIASVNCGECYTCEFNTMPNCIDYLIANEFYNEGYRKIPEGSVVLTEEEFNELRQTIINLSQEHTKKCDEMNDKIIKARKQAVKEVLEMIKNKGTIHTEYDWNDYLEIDVDYLKEIAKEFGVEL